MLPSCSRILDFSSGFTYNSWLACIVMVVSVPVLLHLSVAVLQHTGLSETATYDYCLNVFIFVSAVSQKEVVK